MAVRVFARQYPLALFHDASEPEDKRQIDRHGRCEKNPTPIPAHRPLKQDGKPVGAPESQRHQNQAKQGVHLAFNSPDAALYIVIHLMSWLSGRACEGMQPPPPAPHTILAREAGHYHQKPAVPESVRRPPSPAGSMAHWPNLGALKHGSGVSGGLRLAGPPGQSAA